MKRVITALVLILFPAIATRPQGHAPTAEVCRADATVWGDAQAEADYNNAEARRVTDDVPNRTAIEKLSLKELKYRINEMADCMKVDPARENSYFEVHQFYHSVQCDRWLEFILRHHFLSQFEQEDAAGKR